MFWKAFRKIYPGFVQGLNKNETIELFKENITEEWSTLSMDGSAFDSSQHASIQNIVDNQMYEVQARILKRELRKNDK